MYKIIFLLNKAYLFKNDLRKSMELTFHFSKRNSYVRNVVMRSIYPVYNTILLTNVYITNKYFTWEIIISCFRCHHGHGATHSLVLLTRYEFSKRTESSFRFL